MKGARFLTGKNVIRRGKGLDLGAEPLRIPPGIGKNKWLLENRFFSLGEGGGEPTNSSSPPT